MVGHLFKKIHAWHCARHFPCIILFNFDKQKDEEVGARCLGSNSDSANLNSRRDCLTPPRPYFLVQKMGTATAPTGTVVRSKRGNTWRTPSRWPGTSAFITCLIMFVLLRLILLFYKQGNWDLQRECLLPCHPANKVEPGPRPWADQLQWLSLSDFTTPNIEAQIWGSEFFGDTVCCNKTKCLWTSTFNRCIPGNGIPCFPWLSLAE